MKSKNSKQILSIFLSLACFFLISWIPVSPVIAKSGHCWSRLGYLKGYFGEDISIVGNIAYVVNGDDLLIRDISNPSNPKHIGIFDIDDNTQDVVAVGKYVYVAADGLLIIDVSSPSNPKEIGRYSKLGLAVNSLDVEGTRAYVTDGELKIIDISKPSDPKLLGRYGGNGAFSVDVVGTIAYVGDYFAGLNIIDVSNPKNPKRIGSIGVPGVPYNVTVVDGKAYVADGSDGLHIIDVSTPSKPKFLGGYDTPGKATGVSVSGDIACVADGNGGLLIIDVSTPSSPRLIDTYNEKIEGFAMHAMDVAIVGTKAYVVGESFISLHIIDIAKCASNNGDFCECPDDNTAPTGCISGTVLNASGKPLVGKTVRLKRTSPLTPGVQKTIKTDSSGCYHFENLRNGTYRVWVKSCLKGGTKTAKISKGSKQDNMDFTCK
ncbi:MAG: carboxypeptidase regulatory-like domain-containing protein [Candidatus Brocadiaceae bacterium]